MTALTWKGGAEMSKRNKRRYWQSQRAHLMAMLNEQSRPGDFPDLGVWDYHLEVYRTQRQFGRILPKDRRVDIWQCNVLPF